MPMTPGTTSIITPEIPDFAGNPTVKANSPEKLYIPQDSIRDKPCFTDAGDSTRSPVMGHTPAPAKVAAKVAMALVVTSMEQH